MPTAPRSLPLAHSPAPPVPLPTPPTFRLALCVAQGETQWVEQITAPDAVPNSGTLTLTVGVGRFPAVREAAQRAQRVMRDQQRRRGWADTEALLCAALVPEVYRAYARDGTPAFVQV